ncbi:MAG: glycoside hydrolase [Acidobacteriota bacterium]|nr:glycoside hydrolase [Acidobacteriota bacterium]
MRRFVPVVALLLVLGWLPARPAKAAPITPWPSVQEQLAKDKIQPGSALEKLVLANQSFSLLASDEANDQRNLPPWLRVLWRKAHPDKVNPKDRTRGYPLVLHEAYEWMLTHQDLKPGAPAASSGPRKSASETGEERISGSASTPRSESDIRINFFDPTKIISASNDISSSGQQRIFFSTNSGATWGQTALSLQPGDAFTSDPTVDWTSDGTAWSTTIGIDSTATVLEMRSYKSTNSGATWSFDATFSGSQTSTDKQLMWVDHSATSSHKDNIYVVWHNGLPVFINHRTGPGGSWQTPIQVSGAETTGTGIGADITTNSAGDVFAVWPDTGSQGIYTVKSTNGGTSFSSPVQIATTVGSFQFAIPADASRQVLLNSSIAAYKNGTTNNVYVAFTDLSSTSCAAAGPGTNASDPCKTRIFFVRSTDGGATWSTATKINNQSGLNDQFFSRLVVDPTSGKLGLVYYDTVGDSSRTSANVYYQSSTDGGVTWSTPFKVTTTATNETTAGADSGNQYGDYIGLSGWNGTFFPSWTDRRSGASEEIWTANIADGTACTPPAAPTGVNATAAGQTQVNLSWTASSGATTYNVLRSTTSGGPYTSIGTASGTTFSDTGRTCNTTYFYVLQAGNGTCNSGNSAQAQATTAACTTCTPPAAPTGVTATASGQTAVNLSWTASSGATSYNVLRSTTSGGPYTSIGTPTGTTFSDTGRTCNTTYFYVVTASNGSCSSGNSGQAQATTAACTGCTTQTLYTNGFETGSGLSDWTKGTFVSGGSTTDWRGIQSCSAHGGTHIFRFGGSSCTSSYASNDFTFAQPKGATGIVVGAAATTTRLNFWHRWSFESGFDGGTLAVSVDGGTNYTFVPSSAIISGSSYNGTISNACPPTGAAGASAFTGSQSGFVNTIVNLDAACNAATGGTTGCAGKTIQIAFTSISDCSVTSTGWFLDDVTVTACQ